MNMCTRWWLRHGLKCQARKTPRLTVRWPIITLPLPEGPGVAVSVDYFGPLPVTPRGNIYILLFTDRFSRRADMFPVTAAEFTAEGTATILVNEYIPLWGFARTILSDNGLQSCSKLSQAVYQLLGVHKLATSSYNPNCNGGVERVNHTMAQMLAMVVDERQDDWDLHLPHVEFAYNNSVSAATGLTPNEVHMDRLPRLSLTVFDRTGVVGHQSLARDYLAYCDLAIDRQKRANDIVRAHHALTVSRVNRRNPALVDALCPAPNFAVGGWASVYNSASTIRQGVKVDTDAKVLKAKLALNRTGPYKVLAVGSCSTAETPDGSPLGRNLLYLDLPSDLPGSDARRCVAIERCKPCANPDDSGDIPKYLPAGLTQYVLNKSSKKSPPYHVTQDDVSTPLQRLEVEQITGRQSLRGRGGVIAVLCKTHWAELSEPSWEREMDLHRSRSHILRCWAGNPDQHRQTNRLCRRKRIGAAQRELSRNNGERFLAPRYACVPRPDWLRRYHDAVLPKGAHVWYKGYDGLWWLGNISASTTEDKVYVVRFLDDPGQIKLPLPPARYTTSTEAVRGSWCLQVHIASALPRGIKRNVDESRGVAVDI